MFKKGDIIKSKDKNILIEIIDNYQEFTHGDHIGIKYRYINEKSFKPDRNINHGTIKLIDWTIIKRAKKEFPNEIDILNAMKDNEDSYYE